MEEHMMKAGVALATLLLGFALPVAAAPPGMVIHQSAHDAAATMARLESAVTAKGFTVVARVNHAGAAAKVGESLRPTELIIFGNPKVGTALMQSEQTVGLDLPIRVLVWQAADGTVWLGYNDPAYLTERHGIGDRQAVVDKMTAALTGMAEAATAP
jgi:uncharacterized protein (DUF302 family)